MLFEHFQKILRLFCLPGFAQKLGSCSTNTNFEPQFFGWPPLVLLKNLVTAAETQQMSFIFVASAPGHFENEPLESARIRLESLRLVTPQEVGAPVLGRSAKCGMSLAARHGTALGLSFFAALRGHFSLLLARNRFHCARKHSLLKTPPPFPADHPRALPEVVVGPGGGNFRD